MFNEEVKQVSAEFGARVRQFQALGFEGEDLAEQIESEAREMLSKMLGQSEEHHTEEDHVLHDEEPFA